MKKPYTSKILAITVALSPEEREIINTLKRDFNTNISQLFKNTLREELQRRIDWKQSMVCKSQGKGDPARPYWESPVNGQPER